MVGPIVRSSSSRTQPRWRARPPSGSLARIDGNDGRIALCLTGGSSPKQLYRLLASDAYRSRIPWHRVHWFIGDERFVPESDPLNNMGEARRIFLDQCAPASNIHAIPTLAATPDDSAERLRGHDSNPFMARTHSAPTGHCSISC